MGHRSSLLPPAANLHPVLQEIFNEAQARNIPDQSLADLTGHSLNAIYTWRRGKRAPKFQAVVDLATTFDYDVVLRRRT